MQNTDETNFSKNKMKFLFLKEAVYGVLIKSDEQWSKYAL